MRKFGYFFQLYFLPHYRGRDLLYDWQEEGKNTYMCTYISSGEETYVPFLGNIYPTAQPKHNQQDLQMLLLSQPLDRGC